MTLVSVLVPVYNGEPYLAGTAHPVRARLSATTARLAGVADDDLLTVSTKAGAITAPVRITDMPDHVVWLPTNSAGCAVRSTLGVTAGAVVALAKEGPQ